MQNQSMQSMKTFNIINWFNSFGVIYWCLFTIIVILTTGLFVMQYLK